MKNMSYVKFEVPDELREKALDVLEEARKSGKIKKGTNEVTKAVERGKAKLVIIGKDVEPQEIVMHLPMLCAEKEIPYLFAPKADIGGAVGIHVATAAGAVVEEGKAKDKLAEVALKIAELAK
ncbi:MAG TPA: 50S ribosomal protein L7ae [Candidatus Altiarchaeales archaeon]|nr:50S ribosomal protein L7ae [Candidatus Altiarchaeales archaeon]